MNSPDLHPALNRLGKVGPVVGAVSLALSVVLAVMVGKDQFYQSYLVAYIFWFAIGLGSLAWLMVHHMVLGRWGFVTQRVLEAGSRTLPLLAVFFLPILAGMTTLYPWTHDPATMDEALRHTALAKAWYLNPTFFIARAAIYFAIWIGLMFLLNKWSLDLDTKGDPHISRKYKILSAPGIILYVFTLTFASTDWGMSLEPEWFSTIYGPLFIVGQGLATMCFVIIIMSLLADKKPVADLMTADRFHDLGKLMLAFVVLWAYMSFSQFLITWSGNLPEEIHYYLPRFGSVMTAVFGSLVVFHFFVPFFVLLSRRLKRVGSILRKIAFFILFMRLVDLTWVITPAFHSNQIRLHLMDLTTLVGLGGLWLGYFVYQLKQRPLLPLNDPRLEEAFIHDHDHEQVLDHA